MSRPHHRFLLDHLLRHIAFRDDALAAYDRHVETLTAPQADVLARLDMIPGSRRTAEVIAARTRLRDDALSDGRHEAARRAAPPG